MMRSGRRKIILLLGLAGMFSAALLFAAVGDVRAATNISDTSPNHYAWSENAGWLNFYPQGAQSDVMVHDECLGGYVWAENIGYITLRAPDATTCEAIGNSAPNNYGVTVAEDGSCAGYGWSENAGWINFGATANNPEGVTLTGTVPNRNFGGYAWGENVGYVHFQYGTDCPSYETQETCEAIPGCTWDAGCAPTYQVTQSGPTAVVLGSFTAEPCAVPGCILLNWQTATEIDNAGFHLWRSADGGENYSRITGVLIPAAGTSAMGVSYTHEDRDVLPGTTYAYKLEDIDMSGKSTFHGPAWSEAHPGWCGMLSRSGALGSLWLLLVPGTAVFWLARRRRKGATGVAGDAGRRTTCMRPRCQ